jgi:hypothetical protein
VNNPKKMLLEMTGDGHLRRCFAVVLEMEFLPKIVAASVNE